MRTKFFLKCEEMYRAQACLKETVKPYLKEFDLSGLNGALDHLDSDEARVAALLYASDKVGLDDYNLTI